MQKKIKIFLLIIIVLIFCKTNLMAQNVQGAKYSLPDLYKITLDKSENIKISEENLYISERNKEKAISVLFPRFSTFGNYTRYHDEKIHEGAVIQPESSTSWGLKLSQSFTLNGRELIAFRVAEDSIEKSKYELYAVKEAYLFSVASAYYDVLKSMKTKEIAESNMERLEKHRYAVSIRLKLEEVTKTALYRADAELSKSKADVISAKNMLRLAKAALARIAGLPDVYEIQSPVIPDSAQILSPLQDDKDKLESFKKEALENRAELSSLKIAEKMADDMVKISKGAYFPVMSIEGTYSDYEQDSSQGTSGDDALSIGVNLAFTIYDGGLRNAELKEVLAQKRQVRLAIENISKQIAVEIEQAYLELLTHQSVLKSLEDQLEFARENYNAVSKQFKNGLSDSLDVMDANNLLVTSQKQLSESQYDFQLAQLNLERAKGTFLKQQVGWGE